MMAGENCSPGTSGFVEPDARRGRSKSIWDLPVAAGICVLVSLLALGLVSGVYSDVENQKEQAFLDRKIQTLMLELRAISRATTSIEELHAWDDGNDLVPSLSLQKHDGDWLDPADPFSGNRVVGNQWLYVRRVRIERLSSADRETLRSCKVEIFRFDKKRGYVRVRESRQVLGARTAYEDGARVLDLYVLAIENSPLQWGDRKSLRARLESRILDLEARNPGIRFRTHWITRLAYGRDPWYRSDAVGSVMPPPVGNDEVADLPDRTVATNGAAGGLRVSVADSTNHAMRLIDERRLFERRVEAGLESTEEPTWRLLLEDLHSHPLEYRDAIILNLHGDTLPLPPVRNYSDAARIPELDPGLRVVCHPEKLRFDDGRRGGRPEDVRLRVYAWRTRSPLGSDPGATTGGRPIVLRLPGVDLRGHGTRSKVMPSLEYLSGGRGPDGKLLAYEKFRPARPWSGEAGSVGYELAWVPGKSEGQGYTEIRLHGTASACPKVEGSGLSKGARLYGLEYIPLPVERAATFAQDLASAGDGPKNTARWRIRIPARLLRKQLKGGRPLEVQTSIGEPGSAGSYNRSRTWTWWTSDLEGVPITERFQFLGDPRHNPYADLCDVGESYPSGYNWYFDDLRAGSSDARKDWPSLGLAGLADGWMGRCSVDVPRFFLILRQALRRSHAIFVQAPGPLAFAMSLGGERGQRTPGLLRAKEGGWWARPWIGEIFPDPEISRWRRLGRLPAARYEWVPRERIEQGLPRGTRFASETRRTGFEGATSLMNSGEDWATFHLQRPRSPASRWTGTGRELLGRWSLPTGAPPAIRLPFRLRTSWHGAVGPEWPWQAFYPRQRLELDRSFQVHAGGALGFALISSRQPGRPGAARFLLNGFEPRLDLDAGVDLIVAAAAESLLAGWEKSQDLVPLPRIERAWFVNAREVEIDFDLAWPREGRAQTVKRLEPLEERVRYRCLYSSDGGRTYRRLQDGAPSAPDRPSRDPKEWIPDSQIGPEVRRFKIMPTSASLGDHEWIIRVEAWLGGRRQHHAYHQQRIFHGS